MPERLKKLRKELARKGRRAPLPAHSNKPPIVESVKFRKRVKPVAVYKGPWKKPASFKLKKKYKKKLGGRRSILSALQRTALGTALKKGKKGYTHSLSPGL